MNNTIALAPAQLNPGGCPPFEIDAIERVEAQSALRAVFDVTLPGVVLHKCRLLVSGRGQPWVSGPTSADRYAQGGYRVHVAFDPELAAAILEVVTARLAVDEGDGVV